MAKNTTGAYEAQKSKPFVVLRHPGKDGKMVETRVTVDEKTAKDLAKSQKQANMELADGAQTTMFMEKFKGGLKKALITAGITGAVLGGVLAIDSITPKNIVINTGLDPIPYTQEQQTEQQTEPQTEQQTEPVTEQKSNREDGAIYLGDRVKLPEGKRIYYGEEYANIPNCQYGWIGNSKMPANATYRVGKFALLDENGNTIQNDALFNGITSTKELTERANSMGIKYSKVSYAFTPDTDNAWTNPNNRLGWNSELDGAEIIGNENAKLNPESPIMIDDDFEM